MHGLTGGSWKRNTLAVTDTAVGHPDGKPQELEGCRSYRRERHRASSRPYNLMVQVSPRRQGSLIDVGEASGRTANLPSRCPIGSLAMLAYPAAISLSSRTLNHLADRIR